MYELITMQAYSIEEEKTAALMQYWFHSEIPQFWLLIVLKKLVKSPKNYCLKDIMPASLHVMSTTMEQQTKQYATLCRSIIIQADVIFNH